MRNLRTVRLMMTKNKKLYELALRYLGSRGAAARQYCGLQNDELWCDAFVTYIFYKGGCKELWCKGTKQTYCPTTIKICKGLYAEIPMYLAMPMDVIFFDWEPNGNPNHIGFVAKRISTQKTKTIEGNTDGGKVAEKTRPKKYVQGIFRPHFPAKFDVSKQLKVDGDFGYNSIAVLQKALGVKVDGILGKATVKALQKKVGTKPDGSWQTTTSKKVQKMIGAKVDGDFGPQSVRKLQEWSNKHAFKEVPKPVPKPIEETPQDLPKAEDKAPETAADKIVEQIRIMAWPKGTPKKNWSYKKGRPRNAMKALLKHYGYDTKPEMSDCGNNVNAIVRKSGVDKHFTSLHAVKTPFPKKEDKFKIVISGRLPKVKEMKAGDIIRYKKKGGKDQHAMFYLGHNTIADAGHYNRFFNIRKNDFRYKRRNVKKDTIQVLRAK